ncbi:hypothetical protein PR048_018606 [Dryococelus australis]|uniref:Reverse transcriptase RNase H-like domain-containing protein n=1 Tax=Dryococelus australis TaxID=614101 RepID=A0ABQ9HCT7_9NEOP|nr:hypothetical protein PR048_018606 [Dryococelus australis]
MKFRRLPYELSTAPEIFQKTFSVLFSGLEGVTVSGKDNICQQVCTKPSLTHSSPVGAAHKTKRIAMAAHSRGRAIVMQNSGPIVYASKCLSDCQKNHAQIEKGMLAIVYGCELFHQYIYGRKVEVETDHKLFEDIFQKPIHKCSLRL